MKKQDKILIEVAFSDAEIKKIIAYKKKHRLKSVEKIVEDAVRTTFGSG